MLAGREEQLKTFFEAIGRPHPRLIAVRGLTGRGKSEFLQEIAARVQHPKSFAPNRSARLEYKDTFAALYEIQGEFEDWAFPFLNVLRQILTTLGECGERKQTTQWIGSAMAKAFQQSAGKIAGAIVKDVLEKGFKETTAVAAEILAESLKKVSIEKSLEELLGQHNKSVVAAFLSLLNELAASAPAELRFLLFFDNAQMGTDQFCSALKFLARKIPERFHVAYAFNDEVAEGRRFEQEHWPTLKSLGQTEIELPPMTAPELRRWIDAEKGSSQAITDSLLEEECRATDGRPLYIDVWMKSDDFAQKKVSRPDHLDGYFKIEFGRLSDHAKQVAQIAAMLPGPPPDGCADFAAIFGAKAEDADGWVRELAGARIFGESRERPWFRHSLVQSYVQGNELSAAVKHSLAGRAVEALWPRREDPAADYLPMLAMLSTESGDAEKSSQINQQLAKRLMDGGEFSSALVSFDRADKSAAGLEHSGTMVEILLRRADRTSAVRLIKSFVSRGA